jgi:hypothetical protein
MAAVLAAVAAMATQAALAGDVYEGCASPPTSYNRTFHVDPARGSMANDGSADRPWRTLAEVLDPSRKLVSTHVATRSRDGVLSAPRANADGPIKPGDAVLLYSGEHGKVAITGLRNESFITIAAAPGAIPVIQQLTVDSASRWVFRGVKFQAGRAPGDKTRAVVMLGTGTWLGEADNIVIQGGSVSTTDDVSAWSKDDWITKPLDYGMFSTASCLSIAGTRFFHLRNALTFTGDRTHVTGSRFEDFGNDGIQMVASDVAILRNRFAAGRHSPLESQHADAIQGWTQGGRVNRNILVAGNWIENIAPPDDNYLQGISIFDGEWENVRVENNVVMTNAWHGIALFGVTNAAIVNNTVIPTRPDLFRTWITVREAKTKRPSSQVTVRNNIAAAVIVVANASRIDGNAVNERVELTVDGRKSARVSGRDGNGNVVQPRLFETFADFSLTKRAFDLRPMPNSAAYRAGTAEPATAVDHFGRPREAPFDAGAVSR